MTEYVNDKMFDILLSMAFAKQEEKSNKAIPSNKELSKMYPLPEKRLTSLLKYQKKQDKIKRYGRPLAIVYMWRTVVILLATIAVSFGAVMLNSEVRAAVGKAVVQFFEQFVKVDPHPETETTPQSDYESSVTKAIENYNLRYIPDGYSIENEALKESTREYDLIADDERSIYVFIGYSWTTVFYSDDELRSFAALEIDGCQQAYIMIDDEEPSFKTVYAISDDVSIIVEGYDDSAELCKIVEGIIN